VRCELAENTYPAGVKVSDAEIEAINLTHHDFYGEWNYSIPRTYPGRAIVCGRRLTDYSPPKMECDRMRRSPERVAISRCAPGRR
jgi:hypothetical protein